jgi:hypothetical protein
MPKHPYHFLMSDEDQANVTTIKARYRAQSNVDLSTAELLRTLLRQEAGVTVAGIVVTESPAQ